MIKLAIAGYGNLGRGVEAAVRKNPDIELCAVLTRRDPSTVKTAGTPVISEKDAESLVGKIDVLIICGGSATDLPVMTPKYAEMFNVIDSFDTHAKIPEHFEAVNAAALKNGHTAIISVGWDPGLFSVSRIYGDAVLPDGESYTFWGPGVSQGHSDAVRRIEGVKRAVQYTIPVDEAMERARSGERPTLGVREKHTRLCYVVAEEGADRAEIERKIVTMPNYFDEYDTTVKFIDEDEFVRDHGGMPHGGFVIRSGETSEGKKQVIEYGLKLDSNPEFTGSVLVAYARAAARLAEKGDFGCKTVFDIAPALLSPKSGEELRHMML